MDNDTYPLVYKIYHGPRKVNQIVTLTQNNNYPTVIIIEYSISDNTYDVMVETYAELQQNYISYNHYDNHTMFFIRRNIYNDYGYIYYSGLDLFFRFFSGDEKLICTYLSQFKETDTSTLYTHGDGTYFQSMSPTNNDTITLINNTLPILITCENIDDTHIELLELQIFQENKYTKLYEDGILLLYLLEKRPLRTKQATTKNKTNNNNL